MQSTELFAPAGWRHGGFAGNMSLDDSEHSELIRPRLIEIFSEWTRPFAEPIRQAQMTGEVPAELDPEEAGAALLEAWHGVQCSA